MLVRLFRNRTRGCFSMQARMTEGGWRTIIHASHAMLRSCRFVVSEAARERVLRTGDRSVHAAIEGELFVWIGGYAKEQFFAEAEAVRIADASRLPDIEAAELVRYDLHGSGRFELCPIGTPDAWAPACICDAVACLPEMVVTIR